MTTIRTPEVKLIPRESLTELASQAEYIHVRNTLPNIAVFTRVNQGNLEISEFGPKGDPEGNDVMQLSASYLRDASFSKQLQKGIFEIIDADNPAVVAAFEAQRAAWATQQAQKEQTDAISAAHRPKNVSGTDCIAVDGSAPCSEKAVYATNYRERPPLCQRHQFLQPQYVGEETGRFVNGRPEMQWSRVSTF